MRPKKKRLPSIYAKMTGAQLRDMLLEHAALLYTQEQNPNTHDRNHVRPLGYRGCCEYVSKDFWETTGALIHLSHANLCNRVEGMNTHGQRAEEAHWLCNTEEQVIVNMCIETAQRGFPWSHKRLKEHVDLICAIKYGGPKPLRKFPQTGVGQNWTDRFLKRHQNLLKMSTSVPLESKRGQAVNETANEHYWKLLKDTMKEYDIKPHNIYGADECGEND